MACIYLARARSLHRDNPAFLQVRDTELGFAEGHRDVIGDLLDSARAVDQREDTRRQGREPVDVRPLDEALWDRVGARESSGTRIDASRTTGLRVTVRRRDARDLACGVLAGSVDQVGSPGPLVEAIRLLPQYPSTRQPSIVISSVWTRFERHHSLPLPLALPLESFTTRRSLGNLLETVDAQGCEASPLLTVFLRGSHDNDARRRDARPAQRWAVGGAARSRRRRADEHLLRRRQDGLRREGEARRFVWAGPRGE